MSNMLMFSQVSLSETQRTFPCKSAGCFILEHEEVLHLLLHKPHIANPTMAAGTSGKSEVIGW